MSPVAPGHPAVPMPLAPDRQGTGELPGSGRRDRFRMDPVSGRRRVGVPGIGADIHQWQSIGAATPAVGGQRDGTAPWPPPTEGIGQQVRAAQRIVPIRALPGCRRTRQQRRGKGPSGPGSSPGRTEPMFLCARLHGAQRDRGRGDTGRGSPAPVYADLQGSDLETRAARGRRTSWPFSSDFPFRSRVAMLPFERKAGDRLVEEPHPMDRSGEVQFRQDGDRDMSEGRVRIETDPAAAQGSCAGRGYPEPRQSAGPVRDPRKGL